MKKDLTNLKYFTDICNARDDLKAQSYFISNILDALEQAGTNALVIFEKEGEEWSVLDRGVTKITLFLFIASMFDNVPGFLEEFLHAWDFLRRSEFEPDDETSVH